MDGDAPVVPPGVYGWTPGDTTRSSRFINHIVIQLEIFIKIHYCRMSGRLSYTALRIDAEAYGKVIAIHQSHSHSIGDIHHDPSLPYVHPQGSVSIPSSRVINYIVF